MIAELTSRISRLDRPPATPFHVNLQTVSGPVQLTATAVLRYLPGRRVVVRATLDGRDVLVKLFFGATASRYQRRERTGTARLNGAGVLTPACETEGSLPDGGRALVFEYLRGGVALDQKKLCSGSVLDRVIDVIARLHGHGARQTDLHLNNFLVVDDELYAVDGGGVRSLGSSRRRAIANLASFAAQIDPHRQIEKPAYRAYLDARGWVPESGEYERFAAAVLRARRRRLRRYLRKTLRQCTQFSVLRLPVRRSGSRVPSLPGRVVVDRARRPSGLDAVLADPDAAIASGEILKAGNTATVARVASPSGNVIVKRYNVKNVWHGLRLLIRTSRARRTWQNGHRLLFQDIATAAPVALIESAFGLRNYVILEDLGDVSLSTMGAAHEDGSGLDPALVDAVGELFRRLALSGVYHGDMKATNLLVRGGRVYLIDLDAMCDGGAGEHGRDVDRFLANWDGDVRARFRCALSRAAVLEPSQRPPLDGVGHPV